MDERCLNTHNYFSPQCHGLQRTLARTRTIGIIHYSILTIQRMREGQILAGFKHKHKHKSHMRSYTIETLSCITHLSTSLSLNEHKSVRIEVPFESFSQQPKLSLQALTFNAWQCHAHRGTKMGASMSYMRTSITL